MRLPTPIERGARFLVRLIRLEGLLAKNQKKKPSLRDLSRVIILDDHFEDIYRELDEQTDRAAALIAAALVDTSLERAIRTQLVNFEDVEKIIFDSEAAPLGSFYARTKMARAMGVIGPLAEAHLDAVRRIRNQFAHSALKIDFTNPLISTEIEKLLPDTNPEWKPQFSQQRRRYIGTVVLLVMALEQRVDEHFQDRHDIWTA